MFFSTSFKIQFTIFMSINFFMNICTTSKNGLSVSRVSTQIGHYAKQLWQYRLWIFQERDTKLEMFSAKNQLCRGADYAPHTTASPPGFKKVSTPLSWIVSCALCIMKTNHCAKPSYESLQQRLILKNLHTYNLVQIATVLK